MNRPGDTSVTQAARAFFRESSNSLGAETACALLPSRDHVRTRLVDSSVLPHHATLAATPLVATLAAAPLVRENRVVALAAVAIPGGERPFGWLVVAMPTPRRFAARELEFLASAAALLGARVVTLSAPPAS